MKRFSQPGPATAPGRRPLRFHTAALCALLTALAAVLPAADGAVPPTAGSARQWKAEKEMMEADRAFSKLSEADGMDVAFLAYAADDAVLLREKTPPIKGMEALKKRMEPLAGKKIPLKWEPDFARASASGDLGYTCGHWSLTLDGKTQTGHYVTIWKRQADGRWKWVFDTGNTLEP